jgi:uncharacterized protein
MRVARLICLTTAFSWPIWAGCGEATKKLGSTWYDKCGWKAEDYFEDSKVVALCGAIEANNIPEIDRLVAAGANVNALGKGKMTPLLWAYPDNKLDRFKRLLEHGANPNIAIESNFNSHGGMSPGDSVTHLACKTAFPGYFEAVFSHGGDPNLINSGKAKFHDSPLHIVIQFGGANKKEKIRTLLKMGADINYINGAGLTPTMTAVGWGRQYDIALELLEAGADPKVYQPNSNSKLVHIVVSKELDRMETWTPKQKSDYQKLVEWLTRHGESIKEAKADQKRWQSWNSTPDAFRRKMDAEIAARKAKEAREKAAAGKHE